jgi:hypothetical protein
MDFKTSGDPYDLVMKSSGESCISFTLKKRLGKMREERAGSGEPSAFKKAAASRIEELEGGSPQSLDASALQGYALPWDDGPAAQEKTMEYPPAGQENIDEDLPKAQPAEKEKAAEKEGTGGDALLPDRKPGAVFDITLPGEMV